MSTTMLAIWLTIAVSIMLGMDILEAIVKYRNNKVEEEMAKAYKPPEIAITNPKIIPLKARIDISRNPYIDPVGANEYFDRAAKLLAKEMVEQELMDIRVWEAPETNSRYMEATIKIAKFDDDRDILN